MSQPIRIRPKYAEVLEEKNRGERKMPYTEIDSDGKEVTKLNDLDKIMLGQQGDMVRYNRILEALAEIHRRLGRIEEILDLR